MKDSSKIIVALLAGLATGAVLGILFAPDKGSETRDKLNQSLKDFGDAIKDKAAENFSGIKDKVVNSIKSKFKNSEEEYSSEAEHI